jgi:hypothetical protein
MKLLLTYNYYNPNQSSFLLSPKAEEPLKLFAGYLVALFDNYPKTTNASHGFKSSAWSSSTLILLLENFLLWTIAPLDSLPFSKRLKLWANYLQYEFAEVQTRVRGVPSVKMPPPVWPDWTDEEREATLHPYPRMLKRFLKVRTIQKAPHSVNRMAAFLASLVKLTKFTKSTTSAEAAEAMASFRKLISERPAPMDETLQADFEIYLERFFAEAPEFIGPLEKGKRRTYRHLLTKTKDYFPLPTDRSCSTFKVCQGGNRRAINKAWANRIHREPNSPITGPTRLPDIPHRVQFGTPHRKLAYDSIKSVFLEEKPIQMEDKPRKEDIRFVSAGSVASSGQSGVMYPTPIYKTGIAGFDDLIAEIRRDKRLEQAKIASAAVMQRLTEERDLSGFVEKRPYAAPCPVEVEPAEIRQAVYDELARNRYLTTLQEQLNQVEETEENKDELRRLRLSHKLLQAKFPLLKAVGIPEGAGKTRIITKPNSLLSYVCYPMQKTLMRFLRDNNVFSLIGKDFTVCDLDLAGFSLDGKDEMLLGDYDQATNRILLKATELALEAFLAKSEFTELDGRYARESLLGGVVVFPEPLLPTVLEKGQMMGNVLSFPLLCIINLVCYWQSYEKVWGPCRWRDLPVRINGDDILARTNTDHYQEWLKSIGVVGLKPSAGKNLVSRVTGIVNSQPLAVTNGKVEVLKFVNVPLLLGGRTSKQGEFRNLSQAHNKLLGCVNTPETMTHFFDWNFHDLLPYKHSNITDHPLLGGGGFTPHAQIPERWLGQTAKAKQRNLVHLGLILAGKPTPLFSETSDCFWPKSTARAEGVPYPSMEETELVQYHTGDPALKIYRNNDTPILVLQHGTIYADGVLPTVPDNRDFTSRDWRASCKKLKRVYPDIGERWGRALQADRVYNKIPFCYHTTEQIEVKSRVPVLDLKGLVQQKDEHGAPMFEQEIRYRPGPLELDSVRMINRRIAQMEAKRFQQQQTQVVLPIEELHAHKIERVLLAPV